MREFQEKQKIRRRIYSKTSIFFLLIACFFIAKGLVGVYAKEHGSRMEVERLNKRKAEIESRLATVSKSADRLNTDSGIEYEIRNKFDVVKQGEGVIVVVDKDLPLPEEEKKGFLEKFWHSVTGVFRNDEPDDKNNKDDKKVEEIKAEEDRRR